jgi:hypothetical protein
MPCLVWRGPVRTVERQSPVLEESECRSFDFASLEMKAVPEFNSFAPDQ